MDLSGSSAAGDALRARHWVSSVAVGLCALLLTSCGGESPEPEPLDLPTKSEQASKPTPTPTPTVPSDPKAFIKHFVSLINKAHRTGNPQPFVTLSHPMCRSCGSIAELINSVDEKGGEFKGNPNWRVTGVSEIETEDKPTFSVTMVESAYQIIKEPGAKPEKVPGRTTFNDFTLQRKATGWVVRDFFQVGEN